MSSSGASARHLESLCPSDLSLRACEEERAEREGVAIRDALACSLLRSRSLCFSSCAGL